MFNILLQIRTAIIESNWGPMLAALCVCVCGGGNLSTGGRGGNWCSHYEDKCQCLQNLKPELCSMTRLDTHPKDSIPSSRGTCTSRSLQFCSQYRGNGIGLNVNEWRMDNENVIYTMEFYSVVKNKITKLFGVGGGWMYLRNIILREVTQVQTNTAWSPLHADTS